jgi:type I restriction enzyme S subunit
MNADTLLRNFEVLAEAPDGIDLIRGLCLDLALRGKFHTCDLPNEDLSIAHSFSDVDLGIPNHWGTVSFSELFDMKGGGQPPKSTFVDSPQPGYIRLYQIRDYGPNPVPVYIPRELAPKTTKKGDILLARYGASGKIFWADEGAYNVALAKLIFPEALYLKPFAFLLFKSNWFQETIRSTTRVAVDGFNKNDLKNIYFPLPPLEEQQQVIAEVDKLMALCDQLEQQQKLRDNLRTATRKSAIDAISTATTPEELEAAWKRIENNWEVIADTPESVAGLRSLILGLAVLGKLVVQISSEKTFLEDLSQIKSNEVGELLSSKVHLAENLPNNWTSGGFKHIGRWVGGNGFPTEKQGDNNKEILFCKVSDMNLESNSKYISETVNSIDLRTAKEMRVTPHPAGTVIFPKIGGAIATNKRRILIQPTAIDNNCMGISPCSVIDSEWLFILLQSIDFTKYQSGTSIPSISQRVLDEIKFGIPPLAEQKRIVEKVDELMMLCDRLESELSVRCALAEKFARSVVSAA